MGDFMRMSDGEKHMTRIERAGGTRRTGGSADAFGIQQQKQAFTLDAFKAEVDITR